MKKDTKFLKAYCEKTRQYFGIEIRQIDGIWKAVNFIQLSQAEARAITSEVRQSSFSTNDNLLPCSKCGGRVVGDCRCACGLICQNRGEYNFQCIYCKNLKIDYSSASSVAGYKDGDVVRLSQGQEVKISFKGTPLKRIVVGTGWDPLLGEHDMDVDTSVFVVGDSGVETVYFGAKEHKSGCVIHHGDNVTGNDSGPNDDDENIDVFLDKVPQDRNRLIFVINIYECRVRRQTLQDVKNMYIRLYDKVSHKLLIEYKETDNLRYKTALIIGMAFRTGNEWSFRAIGKGSDAEDLYQLGKECVVIK